MARASGVAVRAHRIYDGYAVRRGPAMVLLDGGRIADVDLTGAEPPARARVVDLGDATLLPGLVDAHVHLAFPPDGDPVHDVTAPSDEQLLARMRTHANRALHAGITTVRDLGDRAYLAGRLREEYAASGDLGPEVQYSGPPITPTRGHCWFLGGEADGVVGVRAAVAERAERGVDVIKIMATGGMLTPGFGLHESQYRLSELAAATVEAHRLGLPITAHAHGPVGIADAVTAGVDGIEHCTFVTAGGVELDERTVDRLAAARVSVGATEAWLPDGPPLPAVAAERLEQCWANFVHMHRSGVRVVCCSDAGIGPRKPHDVLPHGAILFASLGFTALDALGSVTSLAADVCGLGHRKGRLAKGYDADLLAVDGDITADLRSLLDPRAVFRAGRPVPRTWP